MHILFIVNPISGLGLGKELPEKIRRIPEYDSIPYDIVFTEYAGHARKLVEDARQEGKYTHIVAVGGDGTVNEVGGALCGSDVAFGVVSLGSGNGFARHLGYSVFMTKALKQVLTDQFAQIDVLEMNGKYSLNVSGVGFDAEVAHEFNHLKLRGVFSYIYAAIKLWFRYPEKKYKITGNGKVMKVNCFILSFANSSIRQQCLYRPSCFGAGRFDGYLHPETAGFLRDPVVFTFLHQFETVQIVLL